MTNTAQTLRITSNKKPATLTLADGVFSVTSNGQSKLNVPTQRVLWAECSPASSMVTVHVLAKQKKSKMCRLVKVEGTVAESELEQGKRWTQALMDAAYAGIEMRRKLKVLVNPHAGPGKARSIFTKRIEPVLLAAKCTLDVTYTTHAGHAVTIAQEIPLSTYDAIVTVSGDGMAHEVINGFAVHKEDPMKALQSLPIVPVPAGSGNGLSLNLNGIEEGLDISLATLTAIKGRPMPIDLCSILTRKDNKRSLSYMSQCVGLMADLDLGTEHLRFMGSNRFTYGYLRGILTQKKCPVSVSIKAIESDKDKILSTFRASSSNTATSPQQPTDAPANGNGHADETTTPTGALPPMKYNFENAEGDGWVGFNKDICFVYAGKGPYVARDLMQFPVSLPNDGAVDVVVQELGTRGEMIKWMDGAEEGKAFYLHACHYYKASAYRLTPLPPPSTSTSSSAKKTKTKEPEGNLSVDGERFPYDEFLVEVHPGLGRLLSMWGTYRVEFK